VFSTPFDFLRLLLIECCELVAGSTMNAQKLVQLSLQRLSISVLGPLDELTS
jgi:hypothetical protein